MTTLGDYMRWLRSIDGQCRTGIQAERGNMVPVTKLIAPNGRYVIHPGNNQDEILATHVIERFDNRLMVVSPFPSVKRS